MRKYGGQFKQQILDTAVRTGNSEISDAHLTINYTDMCR